MKFLYKVFVLTFFTAAFAGESPRLWELKDGRASEQVASHIDGSGIFFIVGENKFQRVDLKMLHDRDHVYALQHLEFRPKATPAFTVGKKKVYRASPAWAHWLDTFGNIRPNGAALLSRDANHFRGQILAAVDNAAQLNAIRNELQDYRPDAPPNMAPPSGFAPPPVAARTPAPAAPAPAAGSADYFFSFEDDAPAAPQGQAAFPPPTAPAARRPAAPVYRPAPGGQPASGSAGAEAAKSDLERMKAARANGEGGFAAPRKSGRVYKTYRGSRYYYYYNR